MTQVLGIQQRVWRIAWPAILSNISIPLLGLVDAAILGHLESPVYLGAVAIGASILSFLYWGFSFLRMGTTGLVAKAFGARDEQRQMLVLAQSVVLALLLALIVVAFHPLWLGLGLALMDPGPTIEPLAQSYTFIRIYSAPAVLVTYAVVGCFIGRQNTRWPMVIVVTTNVINIGLDFLFIVGFGLNSDGAALATLVAEYCGCALALVAVWHNLRLQISSELLVVLRRWSAYRELMRSNKNLFLRTVCLLFSFAFFTAQSAKLGESQLAANSIMLNLLLLAAYAMDGFAFAVEALTGEAIGARRMEDFRAAVRACTAWCAVTAVAISAVLAAAGSILFPLFTNHAEITALLLQYQPWLVALPLVAAASYLLDGIFIGTAMTRPMMTTMLTSTLLVYLPLFYLLDYLGWGNHGLWFAFLAFNGARGITLGWYYWSLNKNQGWLSPIHQN